MNNNDYSNIVINHLARYPAMTIQDIYKLVYQGCFGSEHAVVDRAQAQKWLIQEIRELGNGPDEPIIDPISPDGHIVRVHLRPFLSSGGKPDQLLEAFLRTAREHVGGQETMTKYWESTSGIIGTSELPFSAEDLQEFGLKMQELNYPSTHHSEQFRQIYRPAYRVIDKAFLRNLPFS